MLAALHCLAPGVTSAALGVANRLLPGRGGIGIRRMKGRDSESALAPSALTALGDRAGDRYNE